MDAETKRLCAVLRMRDRLRRQLQQSDKEMHAALDAWHETRPGHLRGKATEPGARYLLAQAGLLTIERN